MNENEQVTEDQKDTQDEAAGDAESTDGSEMEAADTKSDGYLAENEVQPDPGEDIVTDDEQGDDAEDTEPEAQIAVSADGLPLWKCHKTVAAFKITDTEALSNGQVRLIGEDPACSVVCDSAYVDKHRPQIGGYFVHYHDGYRSWSPAEAFEDGYTPEDPEGYNDSF